VSVGPSDEDIQRHGNTRRRTETDSGTFLFASVAKPTPWICILFEKLTVTQLSQKLSDFNGDRTFITVCREIRYWPCLQRNESSPEQPTQFHYDLFNIILSRHRCSKESLVFRVLIEMCSYLLSSMRAI
jgi:hypothetical protein